MGLKEFAKSVRVKEGKRSKKKGLVLLNTCIFFSLMGWGGFSIS